ncbi:Sulfur carrier protein ThiS (thiamine biosynthesis) [Noviherbaspirillum suwonense]|jgi:molybdopterin converting factor small subunit|uniref:Sulfur carrier protein ThiS (Thiamine biosynthesis) n=2 Tax=Noviherbaspirillum suwonense TaxID=1224511 RepID=A0ABY1QGS7_9BURK|nr:Sulfur carrier protein ThiS (thiamine biosynthesis) [Noviherbaspirillum suwonense]
MRTEASPMKITFKLYATLSDYLPAGQRHNAVELDVEPATTIADLVERFHLPARLVHLVLVNGVYVAPEQRMARTLAPGDALAIWPPVAGG